ncbi:threonine dehydrogenase-like Zn-dependent dehydrogenase [Roseibium hamelinense]|uniref:Threonine dehydrogenase-like Zn-dependent dehydrogenase n=1 Tax=Roseibium hamelinense TaxID=150831 RepID=A0A562T2X6_9HYPH|nr:zinc-binding alcohol dehydrogenase [Roseibium hamelinense]TWI87090.1 threonine dehydrogenase-like Zn-dependent dehydrogenase [Roseibium hamelinense]
MTEFEQTGAAQNALDALWYVSPGKLEIKSEPVPNVGDRVAVVRALHSAISRGTERLIFHGKVPESEWERMRAPNQEGAFPFPVKYGYAAVGKVEAGPISLIGARVFGLFPHQTVFVAEPDKLVKIPQNVPSDRAALAANMETALNALWDAMPSPGDHICVVGGGLVGLLTAYLCGQMPGTEVTVVDVNPGRRTVAHKLGLRFAMPTEAPKEQDLVFHTSANAGGLETAFKIAGTEAKIIEMSWYGVEKVDVQLGQDFHSRRLILKSSQVGSIRSDRQARWSFSRRLAKAMELLDDARLDCLVTHHVDFIELPSRLPHILDANADVIAAVVDYPASDE